MAHIRQILANLSISVADFKKNPKTVIKAVKTEPIAVIINNKPAFYCVPADILESLYQKFYEMNDISLQHLQELSTDSSVVDDEDDDNSFGVTDIFQSIEDEQDASLTHSDSIVDPISADVADPLDDEVAEQLSQLSPEIHQIESMDDVIEEAVEHSQIHKDNIDEALESHNLLCNNCTNFSNYHNDKLVSDHELSDYSFDKENNINVLAPDSKQENHDLLLTENEYALLNNDADKEKRSMKKLEDKAALREVIRDVKQELQDSQRNDALVSGPNSFSLEHVAKTYSPYYNSTLKKNKNKEIKHNDPLSSCLKHHSSIKDIDSPQDDSNIAELNKSATPSCNEDSNNCKYDAITTVQAEGETIKDLHERLIKSSKSKSKKNKSKHKNKNKNKNKSIFF